ncbi:MAG: universal stress protein [Candidatus Korobacteraceae bacterium]|jgi:nucleotide-binding universal stress UspA family protein
MLPARKIVCPTDFSEGASEALENATRIALNNGAEVYLVHVVPVMLAETEPTLLVQVQDYERLLQPEKRLQEMAQPLIAKGVMVHTVIGHGDAASEIVRIAEEQKADVIVIGTHGNTGWRRLAFGSVAEKVVRLATCPVLSVRFAKHCRRQATSAEAGGASKP